MVADETLRGMRVLVIGGTSGMGRAIAEISIEHGAHVVVASNSPDKVARTVAELGEMASGATVDLFDEQSVETALQAIGTVDHLVVTANKLTPGSVRELPVDKARESLASKFWGQYLAAKYVQISPTGSIIFFSGIVSRKVREGAPIINATNAAVEALGKSLALELAPVRVNVISPGFTVTELWGTDVHAQGAQLLSYTAAQPVKRPAQPSEIADVALMLMTNQMLTGSVIDVDGGGLLS